MIEGKIELTFFSMQMFYPLIYKDDKNEDGVQAERLIY